MTDVETSHDKLFKTVFRTFFGDLIELIHPELATTLDLDHIQYLSEDLFADFRKEGHNTPDLVAEATTRNGESQIVLVHVEVEGEFGQAIDQRMPRYSMHLALRENKPVVSIAVFLKGGRAGVEVRQVLTHVGPFEVWRFRYLAFGLSQSLAEEYVEHRRPLGAALAALMRSRVWDGVERKLRCLRAISRAESLDLRQRFLLARVVNTYVQLTGEDEERFFAELRREGNKEVRDMVVTWEEALAEREARGRAEGEARGRAEGEARGRAEGEARGRAEGRIAGEARGRAEGQAKAAQEADLRAAERRFGLLPTAFAERIRAIQDPERLYRILDQILDAESIDDVELG